MAYFSESLNSVQRNYDVYNHELLVLVETCRHFRQYMHQPVHTVKITPIMQIYCTERIQENTIEGLQDGMQNSWNMTSNWSIFQERRMGTLVLYLGAQIMTLGKKTTRSWSSSQSDFLQMYMQNLQDLKKQIQVIPRSGDE